MSDENTVTYSLAELGKGKTDWKRLAEMPEAEIEVNALSDADASPTDYDFWNDARVVTPQKRAPHPSPSAKADKNLPLRPEQRD